MKPLQHAENSVKRYGGKVDDYLPIHDFLDQTKSALGDVRHRAILHNTFGPYICEKVFGQYISVTDEDIILHVGPSDRITETYGSKKISVRQIAEDHITEDCGFIPSLQDWLAKLPIEDWMRNKVPPYSLVKGEAAVAETFLDKQQTALDKLEEYQTLKKSMSASARKVVIDAATDFMKNWPQIESIKWTQYTPFFNDGEPCVFRVHEPYATINVPEGADFDDHDDPGHYDDSPFSSYYYWLKYNKDKTFAEYMDSEDMEYINSRFGSEEKFIECAEAFEKFRQLFEKMDDDFMLDAFDDHAQVTINRNGDIEIDEYDHD